MLYHFWNAAEVVDRIGYIAQWLAVISTVVALVFGMRSSTLKTKDETQRREYAEVATWNYKGAQSISKDYSLPGPLSGWSDDYVRETPDGKQVRFDDEAVAKFQAVAKEHPHYPFPYYFLAEAFRLRGDDSAAQEYARRAIAILEITTKIPQHSPDQDDALKNVRSISTDKKR